METVFLRPAVKEDAVFLYELVNDNECRKNSLCSDPIPWENHVEWFDRVLASAEKCIYICMDQGKRIGQGRLEKTESGCRLSYSIIPKKRGHGYGNRLLSLLEKEAMKSGWGTVYGEVLIQNEASARIFRHLGYRCKQKDDYLLFYKG